MTPKNATKSQGWKKKKVKERTAFLVFKQHQKIEKKRHEAEGCSLTYWYAEPSLRALITAPHFPSHIVSKNICGYFSEIPFNKWKLSVLLHHFIHDEPSVMGLLNKNVSGAGVNLF